MDRMNARGICFQPASDSAETHPAKVPNVERGVPLIHYVGYDDGSDELETK
jgi:hypothetical protein